MTIASRPHRYAYECLDSAYALKQAVEAGERDFPMDVVMLAKRCIEKVEKIVGEKNHVPR